jgi:phosphoribosylformimino-5-aminoimidazole carboxamide ribotide isomerase
VAALYPAIDILDGKAVRLERGDFERRTVYDADPLEAARRWVDDGAERLHVVDLDGARAGRPVNLGHVERIAGEAGVPVQVGGGLRTVQAVLDAIAAGADHVVVGTVAFTDRNVLDDMIERAGEQVRIAIDVRDGAVTTAGWLTPTQVGAPDAVAALRDRGAGGFVYTSVDRDGTMQGPDTDMLARVCEAAGEAPVLYSGGIGELAHLESVAVHDIAGVIVGKALYERRFTVAQAQRALGEVVA